MPEIKFVDVISILPGSIAEGYRQLQGIDRSKDDRIVKEVPKILFVTGPRAAGREPITNAILSKSANLKRWKYLSTDWKLSQLDPNKYDYIDELSLNDLRRGKSIIYEGFDSQNIDSKIILSTLSLEQGYSYVIDGPPQIINNLPKDGTILSTSVWLTAQTKEQFITGAKKISNNEVKDLIDEAAKDIIFYKESVTKFDHTLESGWWEESYDNYELEKVVTAFV
eukprot:CAMPEP_0196765156 /NCGR_PEP_ID=MMETSP1095-20130614/7696_1 /TAXON_ID=96789 ORGANISM="Chromulina nebulosa, Strain UTEXLB2642" /NCGR_SAMPLE_ID=MMETSP1095 /ASSEMBLY_ACC=CAM_ASM_000446 /LENGTH=223 /DNA_ID=CAMNT_0042122673 /DNA_START=915 /DNA_END=1586 /DNA_ORIENTATION=+